MNMQEINFAQAFRKGLYPETDSKPALEYLRECKNKRPSPAGLIDHETLENPITDEDLAVNWPFPVLLRLKKFTLAFMQTAIYEIDEQDWTATQLTTYDITNPAATKAITYGGANLQSWNVADFGDVWFATNGFCFVARLNHSGAWKVLVSSITDDNRCFSLTALDERLFMSSLAWSKLEDTRALAWIEHWKKYRHRAGMSSLGMEIDWDAAILVSERSSDELYYPFLYVMALLGFPSDAQYDKLLPAIYQNTERGGLGIAFPGYHGDTLQLAPLGSLLIAYGRNGISSLANIDGDWMTVDTIGVSMYRRGIAGGYLHRHWFIDQDSDLWMLEANPIKATRLGYRTYMARLNLGKTFIVYDPRQEEVYISDGLLGFCLSQHGLSEITKLPTSLIVGSDSLAPRKKAVAPHVVIADTAMLVKTSRFDFGTRRTKTVQEVETFLSGTGTVTATVSARHAYTAAVIDKAAALDSRGLAAIPHTGVEFEVALSAPVSTAVALGDLAVRARTDGQGTIKEKLNA